LCGRKFDIFRVASNNFSRALVLLEAVNVLDLKEDAIRHLSLRASACYQLSR